MARRRSKTSYLLVWSALLTILTPQGVRAQQPLALAEAMNRAKRLTPAARAAEAAAAEAAARVAQARSAYFPRVDVAESVQRGTQPVFVFGSLLAQRRFTEANFAIDSLIDPDALTNVRTSIAVEQSVFDGGQARLAVRGAAIGQAIAETARIETGQDLAQAAAAAFVRVLQLEAAVRAAAAAVASAESDLGRASARRDAGLATEADVLAVDVHLARMRQRQIAAAADLSVARAELNMAIGSSLDEPVEPVRPPLPGTTGPVESLVAMARSARAEVRRAGLEADLAATAVRAAQAAWFPRVSVQGAWEGNGAGATDQRFSWMVGAQVQWPVSRGLADRARLREAHHARTRASALREQVEREIEIETRAAAARLEAARAREVVGRAALAQARESQRIIRDRYEAGLATIAEVLRAAETTLDAEALATAAELDVVLQGVALDRAVGRL